MKNALYTALTYVFEREGRVCTMAIDWSTIACVPTQDVDNYEYELPSDFEDEEIDEDEAFNSEDERKYGAWFERDGGARQGDDVPSEEDDDPEGDMLMESSEEEGMLDAEESGGSDDMSEHDDEEDKEEEEDQDDSFEDEQDSGAAAEVCVYRMHRV